MAMFENIGEFFKRFMQNDKKELLAENTTSQSKETAKDRLHVVLMQDRANVSADFLEMMKEEIIEVIKKYIVVDESKIDVRLTNEENEDGSIGAPLLHANIPILNIRNDLKGEYMNNNNTSSEKIEGQEEINLDNKNDEEDNIDKTQIVELIKPTEIENISEENNDNKENKIEKTIEIKISDENKEVNNNETKDNNLEVNNNESNDSKLEEKKELELKFLDDKFEDKSDVNENTETKENDNNEQSVESKIEENKSLDLDEEDEEDDDVTFDDLLKAAEEEEKRLKEVENKEKENTSEVEEENKEKEKKEEKKTKKNRKSTVRKRKTSKSKK